MMDEHEQCKIDENELQEDMEAIRARAATWLLMAQRAEAAEAERDRLREALADVRAVFVKLHELWDSDRDVHAGKLVIACLDPSIHYNPLAGKVAAAIAKDEERCRAARSDGECIHPDCPQLLDGEPARSGRSCPLPWGDDE
ncbi:MAG: hypothetical protein IPK79_01125 [Vampirovibrionales bacterium]|nr:hypothetical protein [Vampirovibrionales bacterium]